MNIEQINYDNIYSNENQFPNYQQQFNEPLIQNNYEHSNINQGRIYKKQNLRESFSEPQALNIFSFKMIIFGIAILDFICQFTFLLFTLIYKKDAIIPEEYNHIFLLVDILSRYIFSRIILKTYFYRHQYFSLIFNGIVLIPLCFVDLKYIFEQNEIEKNGLPAIIVFFIFTVIQTILYSLEDVLNKEALAKQGFTPYSLLFYKGVYQLVFFIFPLIIIVFFFSGNEKNANIFAYLCYLLKEKFTLFAVFRFIYGLFNILRTVFLVFVIDVFSSQHLSLLKVLETLLIFF